MTIGPFTSLWVFDQADLNTWLDEAHTAIATLQKLPGFISATAGRSPDEPNRLMVTTHWSDVGSYRRALSSTDSKMKVWPFLSNMHDQPSAFEVLIAATPNEIQTYESSLGTE